MVSMLTRKQLWRRAKANNWKENKKSEKEDILGFLSLSIRSSLLSLQFSVPVLKHLNSIESLDISDSEVSSNIDDFLSTDSLSTSQSHSNNRTSNRKVVSFNEHVKVILVPTKSEYIEASLNELIWWNNSDYTRFKQSASNEIQLIRKITDLTDVKEIIKYLYQPGYEMAFDSFEINL